MQGDREHCLLAGMSDYLSKPLKQGDFAQALGSWLPGQRKPRTNKKTEDRDQRHPAETGGFVPPPSARPAASILNPEVIARLRELQAATDPSLMSQIFASFISDGIERIRVLKNAMAEHDAEALRKTAHALKGSCGTIGAQQMGDVALRLETLAAAPITETPEETLSALVTQIENEFELVQRELAIIDTQGVQRPEAQQA
jgi:HPt (histidine-containing phosphotransfer) domain-containing protein